jgi:class 3 adenylate cyclase
MSWDHDRSVERIQTHLEGMGDIVVSKLKREADLEELLSETQCREIFGAHVYVQVANFARLASAATDDEEEIKRLIQAVHIYQREVSRIVESSDLFDGVRVHFQGAKLHALFYRPIDDEAELAARAVLLQLVLRDFIASVFNPAFTSVGDFRVAAGADIGDVIGTQNGVRGDRELLFVGAPANYAAKIVGPAGTLRITSAVYDALPDDLKELAVEVEDAGGEKYQLQSITKSELDDLCAANGVAWDRQKSRERVDQDSGNYPLEDIHFGKADALIDIDLLSITNNKRVLAASVFADVSGFTRYVDGADTDEKKEEALRVFHALRKEFAQVLTQDFNGVRVQFQGDRIQAFFHLPKEDEKAIGRKVVKAAVAIQSSMETSLKECLPEANRLSVAIGVDMGITLVSKLGSRGARDRICLGEAVEAAAALEERISGTQIGLAKPVYDQLPEEQQKLFVWDNDARGYVASNLTAEKLERAEQAATLGKSAPLFVAPSGSGIRISSEKSADARPVNPAKSYGC